MNKAVFLDRDGVLNEERDDYTWRPEIFNINQGVGEVLAELKKRGYLLIVVTNQGGIDRGMYTKDDVEACHDKLKNEMKKFNVVFDEMYYCAHHPVNSKCICRKPDSLFVEKAIARFDIDATQSYFIGDHERDMGAAEKGGVKGILIKSNTNLKEIIHQIK